MIMVIKKRGKYFFHRDCIFKNNSENFIFAERKMKSLCRW